MTSLVRRLGKAVASARAHAGSQCLARVAINLKPRRSPYGGGNQFAAQLTRALRDLGYAVQYRLSDAVDVVILMESRDEHASIGTVEISRFRERNPRAVVIHRVNECDQRKGTSDMDALLARANALATHTVFVSEWLRDYHAARWFERSRPHSVVRPGADPRIFHPLGSRLPQPGEAFRVATHHWSDNMMKGFRVYAEIDRAIAEGRMPGFELLVVGRWPVGMEWRSARLHEPCSGRQLATLLRSAHAYVTASLWDPGPMHVVEALQCGLPVAYHVQGGGIPEIVGAGGVGFVEDALPALMDLRARHADLRGLAIGESPSGDLMCLQYVRILQRLACEAA